jgi:Ca2+-binding EF-hand superfamily protein
LIFDVLNPRLACSVGINRDEDTIGKDEFMGETILLFENMVEDRRLHLAPPHTTVLTLQESKKMKGKVSGTITIDYNYLTMAKQMELQRATQTIEADAVGSSTDVRNTLERSNSWKKVTSPRITIQLPRLQTAAEQLAKTTPEITSKKQLREVLLNLEVWDAATQYVFWENTTRDGLGQSQIQPEIKRNIQRDSAVIEQALDRVWPLFDLDGDGIIDSKELLTTIAMLTEATPRSRAIFFFDVFDSDKSGYLDDVELADIFRSYWKCAITTALALFQYQAVAAFPSHAQEIHKFIWNFRLEQLQKSDIGSETARHFLSTLDQDGDSRVSREEFVHFVTDEKTLEGFQQSLMSQIAVFVDAMIKELTAQIEKTF